MKKGITSLIIILFIIFLFVPNNILAQFEDTGWLINNFHTDIKINNDTSVDVVESISVDFSVAKHGIYRDIPVNYNTATGNNLNIKFKLASVKDELGHNYKYSVTKSGKNVQIKIGDANKTLMGKHTYVISYSIRRVVLTSGNNAEFYWNVTGNSWPVDIEQVSATITAPGKIVDKVCFSGFYLSTNSNCIANSNENVTQFSSSRLLSGQGLTISTLIDKSAFVFPTKWQEFVWFLSDNKVYGIPIIVLFFMLYIYLKKGRDRRYINIFHETKDTISVPIFERVNALTTFHPPDNLSPGEVGVLVDEVANNKDITAIIIDLARRGFIKITETKKGKIFKRSDFTLTLVNKSEDELLSFEKSCLDLIFSESREKEVNLNKLPKNSYKYLSDVQEGLYKHMTESGYFESNPQKVRKKYVGIAFSVTFIGIFVFNILGFGETPSFVVSIINGVIIGLFAFVMPARSAKGRKALMEVVGLKQYLKVGAWRQKVYEKNNFFEEVLPYTIAFGMTDKFIKAFANSNMQKPSWYEGTGSFNPLVFSNSVNTFNSSFVSGVAATRPKSASSGGSGFSGGGFSGGGFGGGGGGSW